VVIRVALEWKVAGWTPGIYRLSREALDWNRFQILPSTLSGARPSRGEPFYGRRKPVSRRQSQSGESASPWRWGLLRSNGAMSVSTPPFWFQN